MHLRYLGKNYHGWQRQKRVSSLQAELEGALSTLLQTEITCHGCGRTDAGVHASQFIVHFDVKKEWKIDLIYRLNKLLPDDLTAYDVVEVDPILNAQRSAVQRTYHYYVHQDPSPFLEDVSTFYNVPISDFQMMESALELCSDRHDFTSFCLKPNSHKSTVCSITEAKLIKHPNGRQFYFSISADRFLRGMMRFIVMSILELGWGKRSLTEIQDALHNQVPLSFRKLAYPQGLHLTRIRYDEIDFKPTAIRLGVGEQAWIIDEKDIGINLA